MKRVILVFGLFLGCSSTTSHHAPLSTPGPASKAQDEGALMEKLRQSVPSDPATAIALADEGEQRFPQSPYREEREALAIRALIQQQQIGSARSRATLFLDRYPNGPYSSEIAAMTGVHVTPQGPPQ